MCKKCFSVSILFSGLILFSIVCYAPMRSGELLLVFWQRHDGDALILVHAIVWLSNFALIRSENHS